MTGAIIRPRFSSPYLLLLFLTLCLSSTFLPHKYKHLIPRTCPSNFHFPLSTTNTAKRFILWRDTFLLLRTESHSTFTSSSFPATVAAAASFKWQRRRTDGRKDVSSAGSCDLKIPSRRIIWHLSPYPTTHSSAYLRHQPTIIYFIPLNTFSALTRASR